ncbi:hypothetical protein JCM10296v2_007273 [Rhodotorula toruloides]
MAPILPLELQLHILELALTPPIRRNLDRELHEHLRIFYEKPARVDTAAQDCIAAAKEGGWRLKRLDVELGTGGLNAGILEGHVLDNEPPNEQWRLQGDPADFGDLDEMWISLAFADFESFGVTSKSA